MYKELIETLRLYGLTNGTSLGRHMGIMDEAADAIAALRAALSRVEAERDAAIQDLKEIVDDTGDGCQYCEHLPCAQKYGRCIGFVWRGAQGEG